MKLVYTVSAILLLETFSAYLAYANDADKYGYVSSFSKASYRKETTTPSSMKFNRRPRHTFQKYDTTGKEIHNEFQLISPEHISRYSETISSQKEGKLLQQMGISYRLSASPLLINNGDIVTVTFSTDSPTRSDWIAAYSPFDVDITTTVPVKYGWCDGSPSYLTNGNGSLLFNMTNLRTDIRFYYFSNGTSYPIEQNSTSQRVQFKNPNEPLKPRVLPTGDPDTLRLVWSSKDSRSPVLRWSDTPASSALKGGSLATVVAATTDRIMRNETCGSPANSTGWFDLGLIHSAELRGLRPYANRKLYYTFGDNATNDFSREYSLLVPPLPGTQPPSRPTRVILYQDLGRGSSDTTFTWDEYGRPAMFTAMAIGAEVASGTVDAVFQGGDLSYADGFLAAWDFFLEMISPFSSGSVFLSIVGNHESLQTGTASLFDGNDSGGECGVLTTRLLPMPANAKTDEPWWSYDVGLIHFIGISTEHNFSTGSVQWSWLKADLEAVDRSLTPWLILAAHRPMYINSNYGIETDSDLVVMDLMIRELEPLINKHRVNLAFYGHNHVVQRQSAVYNRTVVQKSVETVDEDGNIVHHYDNPGATVHTVIGTGGAYFTMNAVSPPPEWNELTFYRYGYARLTATSAVLLEWEWVEADTGIVYDRMSISQGTYTSKGKDEDDKLAISLAIGVPIALVSVLVLGYLIYGMRSYSSRSEGRRAELVESPLSHLSIASRKDSMK